jgi:hypothetical protein
MSPYPTRRRLMALALVWFAPRGGLAADASQASIAAFVQFDALFIPALFLTGSAGKAAQGPARAVAALKRLREQWPALKTAMVAAVPGQTSWTKALQAVDGHLAEADTLVAKAQWEQSHDVLEKVRELLCEARRSLDIDYALDRFTAYHATMEKLANATRVQRPALEADFAVARAQWRHIETMPLDDAVYGLSPARARQLAQARADEGNALSALSQALYQDSDAQVLEAAAALKPPFVRAYVAFGAPP